MDTPDNNISLKKHNIFLENRKSLSATGVFDVTGFDNQQITLKTELGEMIIGGNDLKINRFSQENGELDINGEINSVFYSEDRDNRDSFFSKLFR